jgi:hypothetical protein
MEAAAYQELLRPLVEGRRVVLVGGPVSAWAAPAALLRQLGAEAILVVGTEGQGAGAPPADVEWVSVGGGAPTVHESIRRAMALVRDPPQAVQDAVSSFDPEAGALTIGSFLTEVPEMLGRPFLAWRRPEWIALEDKTTVDALWDRAGVERAPSLVVALERNALARATHAIDAGAGVVWAGDASRGWHGGAELTRPVRSRDDADFVFDAFAGRCREVRVMPFIEGVPCSVHGIVYPDYVVAVRPVEMVCLRRHDVPGFFYAGCATFYDPPDATRDQMRAATQRVGDELRASVGFRGAFTIDGVAGSQGFVPTELNPRSGGGLNTILRAMPSLPVQTLLDALVGGVNLAYDPRELEDLLVTTADKSRAGGTWAVVDTVPVTAERRGLVGGADGWRWAGDETPSAELLSGGHGANGFVRLAADANRTPVGPPFGPAAAAFWEFADRELGTRIGPLEPYDARVRSSR